MHEEEKPEHEAYERYPFRFIFSLLLYERNGDKVMDERRDLEVMGDNEHFAQRVAVRQALSEGYFVKDIRTDKKFKKKKK